MPLSHAGPPADPHPPGLSCTCHRPSAPAARSAWAAPLLTPCIRGLAWGLPLAATQAESSVWLVLCRVQATSFIFHPQGHLAPASTHSCLFKHSVPSFSTVPHRPACSSPSHSPQSRPSPPRPPPSDRHTGRPPRVLLPPCRGVGGGLGLGHCRAEVVGCPVWGEAPIWSGEGLPVRSGRPLSPQACGALGWG